ncbi:MAG: glycosyltransferase family 2 protein [Candidatus Omnitrophota bacterium]
MVQESPCVDIITVNYNGAKNLEDFFTSLKQLDYPKERLRLFFVDNASSDNSVEFARGFDPGFRVEVVANRRNEGFAKGNNRIFPLCQAPFIALLNNDAKVEKDWLSKLVLKIQSDKAIAITGSRQVPQESSRFIDPGTQEASWCGGGHCLIRKEALDSVGYFDEGFFMYGEDVDLCWRMWLAGYKCVYVPEAVCQHHYNDVSCYRVRRLFYHVRNSILLRYSYGDVCDIKKEIARWGREGLAMGLKRLRFKESCAILAGAITHFLYAGYFLKKGRILKAGRRFNGIRSKWITL